MAGDWIKMRTTLLTNPKVNGIARILEESADVGRALSAGYNGPLSQIVTRTVTRHVTVSSLLIIWGAANEHTKDGVFVNADLSDIDDMVGIPGFAGAMVDVGWAVYDSENNTVTLPNFCEYNTAGSERSASAKTGAQRQKEYRERKSVSLQNRHQTSDVTSDVTSNRREEKRREENISADAPTAPAAPRFDVLAELKARGVSDQTAADWITLRKSQKAVPTKTVLTQIIAEADKAGMSLERALAMTCLRGWRGFKAEWVKSDPATADKPAKDWI